MASFLASEKYVPTVRGRRCGKEWWLFMKELLLLCAMLSLASLCWAGSERRGAIDRLNNAAKVLNEIMTAPDRRIPEETMKLAKCVAVVSHLIKGGFAFVAVHGNGVPTCPPPQPP